MLGRGRGWADALLCLVVSVSWRGVGTLHQVSVTYGLVADGELKDPVEHEASAARAAPIEPEGEFVEVAGKVFAIHGTFIAPRSFADR